MTQTEQIVKAVISGDVVAFRQSVSEVLAGKATEALAIQKIQTGLTLLSPKE